MTSTAGLSDDFDQLVQTARLDAAERWLEERRPGLIPDDYQFRKLVLLSYGGRYAEAYSIGRELEKRQPENAMLRFCMARLAVSLGHWQEGLLGLDHCRNYGFFGGPYLTRERPIWSGEPLAGRTLLLRCEGGLGDIVCFARFARDFEKLGANVVLVADQALFPLLKPLVGRGALVAPDAALKVEFDYWVPALSAPRLLGLEPEKIDNKSYLHVPAELVDLWRREIAFDGLKIALIWKGDTAFAEDHFRSLAEEDLSPLTQGGVAGARFYAIHPSRTGLTSFSSRMTDPLLLAGFLRAMDLVISVDTGPAHLAGALGVPTILLNRVFGWFTFSYHATPGSFAPSPWYRSMRVLQQKHLKQWSEEMAFVRDLLNSPEERQALAPHSKRDDLSSIYHPLAPAPSPDLAKLVETVDGPMFTVPNDYYVGRAVELYGEYSRPEAEIILQNIKAGDHVVEAGAHFGAMTVAIARQAGPQGRVIAFEPQDFLRQILRANLALQDFKWAEVHPEALADQAGEIELPVIDYTRVGNFGAVELGDLRTRARSELGVKKGRKVRLDDLALDRLDFLKLDVEGMELEALKGAEQLIRRCQPKLWIEVDREERRPAIEALLRSWGYVWQECFTHLYNPKNFKGIAANIYGNVMSFNILAVPEGRSK